MRKVQPMASVECNIKAYAVGFAKFADRTVREIYTQPTMVTVHFPFFAGR